MPQPSLNVQCFVEKQIEPIFTGENQPKLLYVSEIRPDASAHPRVMHAHEDAVELILICQWLERISHSRQENRHRGR